jgi:hypothetical protein
VVFLFCLVEEDLVFVILSLSENIQWRLVEWLVPSCLSKSCLSS